MRTQQLSEDEAISLISIPVDFGVTQVVDLQRSKAKPKMVAATVPRKLNVYRASALGREG